MCVLILIIMPEQLEYDSQTPRKQRSKIWNMFVQTPGSCCSDTRTVWRYGRCVAAQRILLLFRFSNNMFQVFGQHIPNVLMANIQYKLGQSMRQQYGNAKI